MNLDCFVNRIWVGPDVQPSLWAQVYAKKSRFRSATLNAASQFAATGKHFVIVNAYAWDIDRNVRHGTWPAPGPARTTYAGWVQSYNDGPGIVASRVSVDDPQMLKDFIAEGYDIWIDDTLYREMFQRYSMSSVGAATGDIRGAPCHLLVLPK